MMRLVAGGVACLVLGVLACGGQASDEDGPDEGSGGDADPGTGGNDHSSGGANNDASGGRQGSGGEAENSGGSGSGGEPDGGSGGDSQLTECISCEPGYECFEAVALDRCFKLCETETPNV